MFDYQARERINSYFLIIIFFVSVIGLFLSIDDFYQNIPSNKLEKVAKSKAEKHTKTDAVLLSKHAGLEAFFDDEYKLVFDIDGKKQDVYVSPEEYLDFKVGQKACINFIIWKGKQENFGICK